jgi:hypothetical protein
MAGRMTEGFDDRGKVALLASGSLGQGDASPASVARHIERVSDKATERIYDRGMVIPLALL